MGDRFRLPRNLPSQLAEHGIPLQAVLRRAGLPAAFFEQEAVQATTSELFALWRAIGETSGDPAIGLALGADPRVERHHPTSIAAACSRTFRDALERMDRYKRLTCPEEIRVRSVHGKVSVDFAFPLATEQPPDVLVDVCLSWILSIGRRGTDGAVAPVQVELTRPSRGREALEAHYGCRVRFKAARNALIFRDADLDLPFVTYNPDLLAAVSDRLETELTARRGPSDVRHQVKQVLERSMAGKRPSLEDVARELHVSARTLQRRLMDSDVTFQQLVEETRRELARRYLGQSKMELNEAAYLLGYEDANSFFRAFQSWEGSTPARWRTRAGAAAGRGSRRGPHAKTSGRVRRRT